LEFGKPQIYDRKMFTVLKHSLHFMDCSQGESQVLEAWYMDDSSEDQRLPHRLNANVPVSAEALKGKNSETF
jgi:hypothetical protein